jgi:hypothetical protein
VHAKRKQKLQDPPVYIDIWREGGFGPGPLDTNRSSIASSKSRIPMAERDAVASFEDLRRWGRLVGNYVYNIGGLKGCQDARDSKNTEFG